MKNPLGLLCERYAKSLPLIHLPQCGNLGVCASQTGRQPGIFQQVRKKFLFGRNIWPTETLSGKFFCLFFWILIVKNMITVAFWQCS
jgi:hypothetical protein